MSYRIVLADDHHIVRQGLRALLEKEGLKVIAEAENGRDAVQLAHTHKPDVVVLDLMMPLLNGLEAGREIIQSGAAKGAILLTMHTQEHQIAAIQNLPRKDLHLNQDVCCTTLLFCLGLYI